MHQWIQDGDRTRANKAAKSFARFGGPIVDVEAEIKALGVHANANQKLMDLVQKVRTVHCSSSR